MALRFILFDIETIFLYPAVVYRELKCSVSSKCCICCADPVGFFYVLRVLKIGHCERYPPTA
ncbi:MAG: NADH-quinone oxidoreductase subunit A [Acidobacteriia bacterium]|nr:NADH-quinone oxidoreductase subunit A [Terriglobia bacterium]MBV8904188.1 NADH-quinone oxidoreductase subunit A [Terriglobia bacterium]MBV9745146.1 NADH-quinone oxidoreductase subunit A [Terriglobia bacterium]